MRAISQLAVSGLRHLTYINAPLIKLIYERGANVSGLSSGLSPIFIIGAPRTGSTILCQILTHISDVLYVDNLADILCKNLYAGVNLSQAIYKDRGHDVFVSENGVSKGWHAPSECPGFWYRWLPRDHHFVDVGEISDASVCEIRNIIYSIIEHHQKPFLFKNLNAGQRLRLLKDVCPDARFIYLKRNPFYTVQSIIKARRALGVADSSWWSVMPKDYEGIQSLPLYAKIVNQVYSIERQIDEDLQLFPAENIARVGYADIASKIPELIKFIGAREKQRLEVSRFSFTNERALDDEVCSIINEEIDKLDWNK